MRLAPWLAGSLALTALVASAVEGPPGYGARHRSPPDRSTVPGTVDLNGPEISGLPEIARSTVPGTVDALEYPDICHVESGFTADGARAGTARALEAGLARRGIAEAGQTWIGRMDSVGGGARDVIVWVPRTLDPAVPVDVVVYMEGYGSFADAAMDRRHAGAIEALAESTLNVVYVAPDAPSSSFARDPRNRNPYWRRGARKDAVDAPGDFAAFLDDVAAQVRRACPDVELRHALVGFSNGGRGVRDAVKQLARAGRLDELDLVAILFADGNYGRWMADTAAYLGDRDVPITLVRGRHNRRRSIDGARELRLDATHDQVGDRAVAQLYLE